MEPRKDHCEGQCCFRVKRDTVETICDIKLGHIDGTEGRVCVSHIVDQSLEGPSELHCLFRHIVDCLSVDSPEGEINNKPWSSLALRDNPEGR